MEAIKLNLIPTGALPVVHASQYDDGRTFRADLYDGAEVYHLDGTETISCELKKPDGNIVTLAVTNTSESFIEIQTTEQACAVAGESLAEVKIEKGADKIGSLNFILSVERSPIEGGISSASEINNLWTQVDGMVADILADSYDSANVVFDNLPTAGHGIPYTVTSEGIGNAIDNALEMTAEASGAIATFESEYALPLRDLEIEINAVQESGTPTPSSPKLISGFTGANIYVKGKNLVDFLSDLKSSSNGLTISINNGGIKFVNQPTTSWADLSNTINVFLPKGTYTFSRTASGAYNVYIDVVFVDNTSTTMSITNGTTSRTVTYTKDIKQIKLHLSGLSTSTTYNETIYLQFELAPSATAYHAYNANSTTTAISWNDEAGTVYGGSLDVTSGKLTVTHAIIDLGDLSWTYDSAYTRFASSISGGKSYGTAVRTAPFICSCYQTISDGRPLAQVPNNSIYNGNSNSVYVKTSDYTDEGQFTTAVTGEKLVYELATPQTYQLTPTQISAIVGTNNIFTDTNGNTSVEYYTKRGEQTVRIAEGVAVDVINNKSIDTLTTTDKTVNGAINELDAGKADSATTLSGYGITDAYTKTEVNNALALKFDDANRVTTGTGTFAGLLNVADRVWLITAQRLSTNNTLMLIAHKQNGNFYFKEIVKDAGMEYNYNSENGSVVVTYGGSTTGVYGGAYRLA